MSAKYIIKILTLGDSKVGKTSIILRYINKKFIDTGQLSTIGIDFKTKFIEKGGEKIKVTIYDTAGQERFRNIIKHYYKGSNGVLLTYDIANKISFKNLDFWIGDLKENADNFDDIFICLIGNKNDKKEEREVSIEEADKYAKEKNLPFFEVSAKTGEGIQKLFNEIIKGAMKKMLNSTENVDNMRLSFLDKESTIPKKKGCC